MYVTDLNPNHVPSSHTLHPPPPSSHLRRFTTTPYLRQITPITYIRRITPTPLLRHITPTPYLHRNSPTPYLRHIISTPYLHCILFPNPKPSTYSPNSLHPPVHISTYVYPLSLLHTVQYISPSSSPPRTPPWPTLILINLSNCYTRAIFLYILYCPCLPRFLCFKFSKHNYQHKDLIINVHVCNWFISSWYCTTMRRSFLNYLLFEAE